MRVLPEKSILCSIHLIWHQKNKKEKYIHIKNMFQKKTWKDIFFYLINKKHIYV